ncbi:THAP domain [Popillia japonica]|uniref:THAP domain n=1 Tax=Popillia japonica TaxID=7064 RepID=A0AAW1LTL4_POPJA
MGKAGCVVLGCNPSKTDSRHSFSNPGKEAKLFKKWVTLTGNKQFLSLTEEYIYTHYRICSKHFNLEDFGPNRKLKKIVFPKCYLPESSSAEDTLQIACCELPDDRPGPSGEQYKAHLSPVGDIMHTTSTSSVLLEMTSTKKPSPKTKYLYSKISLYKNKYAIQRRKTETNQQHLANAKKYSDSIVFAKLINALNVTSRRFFKSQIACSKKKLHGRRFTASDKITALALFKETGSGYKFLLEMFALPSRVTIMKLLNDSPIGPGLNSSIIEGLTEMAKTLKPLDKYCILTFDEMSIIPHLTYNRHKDEIEGFKCCANDVRTTKIADHAQVFMLRGLNRKWKQPVLYQFVKGGAKASTIIKTIKELVIAIHSAGFIIVGTVCDQGANNNNMSRIGKKHKTWNPDQMKLAIRAVREKEMGYLKTSKVFDVPKSTLEDYVKQFDKTPEQLVAAPIGRRPVLSLEMEEDLVSYCLETDRRFYGLGTADIKRLAMK